MRIFAVPRWVFGFWTWNFDTWFSSSSPRHSIVDTFFVVFFQPTYGRPNVFPDPQIGKKCTKMFFFFCVHLCVSWWARAQSRVKSSISNSQNWAGQSDISKIMASWPAQLVQLCDNLVSTHGVIYGIQLTSPCDLVCRTFWFEAHQVYFGLFPCQESALFLLIVLWRWI